MIKKTIAKNSILYLIAVGANRGMPFLLVPLLTRYLTVEEFGYLGIATVILGLLTIVVGLNPSLFVIRNFCRLGKEDIAKYVYHGLLVILAMLMLTSLILWLSSDFLRERYDLGLDMLLAIAVIASMAATAALILTVIQMEKNAFLFLKFSLTSALLQLVFVVSLVVLLKGGWKGKIVADLIAAMIFGLLLLFYSMNRSYISIGYTWHNMKNLLVFSLPLLPHALSMWGMNFIDRFFLAEMVNVEVVGLYSAAYLVGMGMMLLHDSMQRAWQPFFFERLLGEDLVHKARIVKYTWLYYLGCIIFYFIYVWTISLIMPYLMGDNFQAAFQFIPLVVLGFTFNGMCRVCASCLYHVNRTGVLATVSGVSVILNFILNYMLILRYGAIGAAQATAITYLFYFLAVKVLAAYYYKMPWFTFYLHRKSHEING